MGSGLELGSVLGLDVRERHQPGDGAQHVGDELHAVVRVGPVEYTEGGAKGWGWTRRRGL